MFTKETKNTPRRGSFEKLNTQGVVAKKNYNFKMQIQQKDDFTFISYRLFMYIIDLQYFVIFFLLYYFLSNIFKI